MGSEIGLYAKLLNDACFETFLLFSIIITSVTMFFCHSGRASSLAVTRACTTALPILFQPSGLMRVMDFMTRQAEASWLPLVRALLGPGMRRLWALV